MNLTYVTYDYIYLYIYIYEFFYKYLKIIYIYVSLFVQLKYIDFLRLDFLVYPHIYRVMRLNFANNFFFSKNIKKIYMKGRVSRYLYDMNFYVMYGMWFFIIFDNIRHFILKINSNFMSYLIMFKLKNSLLFIWNDVFSRLIELNDVVLYRNVFLFKYDLPKIVFRIYLYIDKLNKIWNSDVDFFNIYFSIFGFSVSKNLKSFKRNLTFYSRIL